ncbi:MAG: thiolase family protein [Gammaproteobacteria bacterium]|nr:MAG: thiolase family protein [Gammaproteobacteria bacterium]
MRDKNPAITSIYNDIWLIDGVRTPFVDYKDAFSLVSPTDLGIKAAMGIFARTGLPPEDVGAVVAGCMAQAAYDAYVLPRHIGLYSGVPVGVPSTLVQRVCGTGFELLLQAADAITLGKIELGLCVAAESMSRNPIAAYTHRNGFNLGQVEFKDFLWEALIDSAIGAGMGVCAERLAVEYSITRTDADAFACASFERAIQAQENGFLAGEIVPVTTEKFELEGYKPRGIKLPRGAQDQQSDTHVRRSPMEVLAKLPAVFDGVQTGGNSSGITDGAGAALVAAGSYIKTKGIGPLGRLAGATVVGVPPENMGIGPVAAIRPLLARAGLKLADIDRFEINEAFAAQCLAVERELGLDHAKVNVNGGAIAIGHPLAASGVRLATTLSRELRRSNLRYGIASACIGGGQGIALLIENPKFAG